MRQPSHMRSLPAFLRFGRIISSEAASLYEALFINVMRLKETIKF